MTNVVTSENVAARDVDEISRVTGGMRLGRYDVDIGSGIAWPTCLYDRGQNFLGR